MPTAAATNFTPLSQRINAATRPLHAHLNALILSLLPLALPPHADTPARYAHGMASFVPVYEAFEGVGRGFGLRGVGKEEEGGSGSESESENGGGGEGGQELLKGLRGLCIRELERGGRLRGDVERMLSWSRGAECRGLAAMGFGSGKRRPCLEAFTGHIRTAITLGRSHLLLAYVWVLYMALFSGGRYIRARLRQAGGGFWGEGERRMGNDDEKGDAVDRCLGFWTFEGEEDGEDLKVEFKARFASVEGVLTEVEKEEVVQEAVFIMHSITAVVVEISEAVGTDVSMAAAGRPVDDERMDGRADGEPSMRWLLLKHVLPMGMVELLAAGAPSAVSVGMLPSFWTARAK